MAIRLSENEKREVVTYLEQGKPLPEKYRFLLFKDDREVELVWNGKTNEVTNVVLPFQVIEQIDEPREGKEFGEGGTLFDMSGKQITGWTNKLIWGDNKLILSSLKNGPMRKEIEAQGGLKLIYIDPPFDVGADFSMNIEIGEEEESENFTKKPSVIEEIAYRDTWGKGADSFIAMIYERLKLMHELLAEDGSIYVHCDWRVNSYMRLILDEIFGKDNFRNEISVNRIKKSDSNIKKYNIAFDSLFYYSKSIKTSFNSVFMSIDEKEGYWHGMDAPGQGDAKIFFDVKISPPNGRHWAWSQERIDAAIRNNILRLNPKSGKPEYYIESRNTKLVDSNWSDLSGYSFDNKYPTEKSEKFLQRILEASSNPGDLVADFFCGSGTTLSVAEKLGRKWIGTDLGKFGIHTTRKRMIGVQRELKKEGKDFRAFEILNLGKYERERFVSVNQDLRAEEKAMQAERKEKDFIQLILTAYKAESLDTFKQFVGKKRDRLVAVGPINFPASSEFIQNILEECVIHGITKVDVLAFDYEMGLDTSRARDYGIDIALKVIPREVFDRRAIDRGQVAFYDVSYIEVRPIVTGRGNIKELSIELTDFSVFYTQDNSATEELKAGKSKIAVQNGQVLKISKDKDGNELPPEVLTKKWSDWIDYWAVDYNFADRKEIIRVPKTQGDNLFEKGKEQNLFEYEEKWTGGYIFDNEWQSFRTKKNRKLELVSAPKEMEKGNYKVAIKVVDIFGNDTTKVIEVRI
jgi:DNA modification methylase